MIRGLLAALAVAALSALLVAPAPSYDPWAWLLWGRELTALELSTAEGPAFKPLPVAVCALLAPLGGAAPALWVIVARTGAVLAVWLAFRLGRRLGNSIAAGVLAAAGVALCGGFVGYAAAGAETGWTIALALAAAEAWRSGHPRAALACGLGCALLRVEAWPFLLVAGIVLWRRRPQDRALPVPAFATTHDSGGRRSPPDTTRRSVIGLGTLPITVRRQPAPATTGDRTYLRTPVLAACAVAVPALWFVPELLGSGDVLRSGSRARVPNPGQPATAAVPALAALREAATLLLWPLLAGAVAAIWLARPARGVLAAGLAWIALVAVMAQAGFSGEPRYSLPGGALVAIAGAAGLVALMRAGPRIAAPAAAAIVLAAAAPKLADLPELRSDQAYASGLAADLERVIGAAGGRAGLLACGRPYVGHLRGPLLAYHLDVEKRRVGFVPAPPGAVFRSRLHARDAPEPAAGPPFATAARAGRWEVRIAC